jgi:hypothetical protein
MSAYPNYFDSLFTTMPIQAKIAVFAARQEYLNGLRTEDNLIQGYEYREHLIAECLRIRNKFMNYRCYLNANLADPSIIAKPSRTTSCAEIKARIELLKDCVDKYEAVTCATRAPKARRLNFN